MSSKKIRSEQILDEMEPEDKEEVEELLEFRDNTAGGIMDTGFLVASAKTRPLPMPWRS